MLTFNARKLAAVVVLVVSASLVAVAGASAWTTYGVQGVVGPFDQPHLACTYSGNRMDITITDPDVGGRYGQVYRNSDGSYTTGWGTGGPQEWVYYQASLYRATSTGWQLLGTGPLWKTYTGPWKPNVYTYSNWFNVGLNKWDYQMVYDDGIGGLHPLMGGPTKFINAPIGPRYAVRIQYSWERTANYGAASAFSWQSDPC
jgi:hypothetical protein